MFAGINMFWARLRLILARAAITINITLEGIEKIKTVKMTTEQSEQSREHSQVEWLLFFPQ